VEYKVCFILALIKVTINGKVRDPAAVKNAYTENSIWRNRDTFLRGHAEIVDFLTKKWAKENGYRLRKELFAFTDNKVGGRYVHRFPLRTRV
jgi:uncharacterized protein